MSLSAPVITASIPTFRFPNHSVTTLANGVRLIVVPDTTQELLTIAVVAKSGATQEEIAGQAMLSGAMLSSGTTTRSARQIADAVDSLGASLNTAASWDNTGVSITGLGTNADAMLDVLSDCVLNPAYAEEEFTRAQKRALGELQFELSDPNYLSSRAFVHSIFGSHPYAHQRIGTAESLMQLRVEDCRRYYEKVRTQSQWYIVVAGNADESFAYTRVAEAFAALHSASAPHPRIVPTAMSSIKTAFAHLDSAQQTVLTMGHILPTMEHPDIPALHLMNTAFGGYFMARTNAILREEKGFTYGAFSYIDSRYHTGDFTVSTSISDENVAETIAILRHEWQRLVTEPFTATEVERARKFLLGSFVRSMETPQQ